MKTNIVRNIKIRSLNIQYIKTTYLNVMKLSELTELNIRIADINFLSDLEFL